MSSRALLATTALLVAAGCSPADEPVERITCDGIERPVGWTKASHCADGPADYASLFSDDVVHKLEISMELADHQRTMDDLATKLAGPEDGDAIPDPIWVPVTVTYDGLSWTQVGFRYKGNSALKSAYQKGVRKLSFRLGFDHYEDGSPELHNQRFYGFKKLVFANGFEDPSLIREKLAASIFADGGVPAARTAFCQVYVETGQGPVYFGLYTMLEDPSNKLLDTQFKKDDGNLYKPEGEGAKLKTFVQADMIKKTNEKTLDFSDVEALITALNADRTNAAAWRGVLEQTFDVPGFLKALALNQAMQNWDAYGFMPHNYYLYADEGNKDRLTWIPWDLTRSMLPKLIDSKDTGSVLLDQVSADWPLIRHLLDDPTYLQTYKSELTAALAGPLSLSKLSARMDAFHALIAPYVVGPEGELAPYSTLASSKNFDQSLSSGADALKPHLSARHVAVKAALGL